MNVKSAAWHIWPAGPSDIDRLEALEAKAFGARSWGVGSLRGGASSIGVVILAGGERAGVPSGFAIWRDLKGEAELLTIGVDPHKQRAGLGAALLEAAVQEARAAGSELLYLEVDAGNAPALALYEKAGFVTTGLRKAYYRDGADARLMQLKL